jgi:hypothetical protein
VAADWATDTGEGPIADPTRARVGIVDDERLDDELIAVYEDVLLAGVTPTGGASAGRALRAIALAVSQKGMREQPCGSNVNAYSRYFGYGAQAWCADFLAWVHDRTGNRNHKVPWGYPSRVANITEWARSEGLIRPRPAVGQIFTYRDGAHAGFVTGARSGGFTTLEGNTSGPDGRTCCVYDHRRRDDGTYHYIGWAA